MTTGFLCVAIFVVSVIFSMLGQGGGVLYTPLQVWTGTDFHVAATTSLFLIMVTSLSATLVFRKARRVDWPLALLLESVTAVGGFVGGVYSAKFSGQLLSAVFAVFVAAAAVFMIGDFKPVRQKSAARGVFFWKRQFNAHVYYVNVPLALGVSLIAGLVSGLTGVGGGILKVPLMTVLLGIPMEIAVGSSAFMVGLTALGGFSGHVVSGHWDWKTSLVLAVLVFIGGQIGSRRSLSMDKRTLKKGFGFFLLLVVASMIVRALQ